MKVTIIRTLKIIAVLIPVLALLILDPGNTSNERNFIRDFYREEEDSLDVVVLGASEVFTGYSAPLAYEEYGFTSYPYAISMNLMELYASQLEEIYSQQSPQMVVVEITPGLYTEPADNKDAVLRNYIGRVPLSWNKIRTVWEQGDHAHFLSYHLPFMMYHNTVNMYDALRISWEELHAYGRGYSLLKNGVTSTSREFSGPVRKPKRGKRNPISKYEEKTLRTFLGHCKEKEYDNLLFVTFPHRVTTDYAYERSLRFESAGEVIESYGYRYINLENASDQIGLDPASDYYNDDHLNLYGQEKLTSYLSELLVEECSVKPSNLPESVRDKWERSVDYTQRYHAYFDKLYREKPDEEVWLVETGWVMDVLEAKGPVS